MYMYVYVCMYMYICICIYVCIYVCICICLYMYVQNLTEISRPLIAIPLAFVQQNHRTVQCAQKIRDTRQKHKNTYIREIS